MSKPIIEFITCESGDWDVLRIKIDDVDQEYSGHSIYSCTWLEILRDYLGCEVITKVISDEDMEEGNY